MDILSDRAVIALLLPAVQAARAKPPNGWRGIRLGSCKSLHGSDLEQSAESSVIKSVITSDNPENEHLADVISAWSFLPSHIQEAILLLVRRYVQ